jgi:hypothetical protein
MPVGGENIGTAYVRILASGKGFDQSVEQEVEKSGPAFKKAGRQAGDEFSDGFTEELSRRLAAEAKKHDYGARAIKGSITRITNSIAKLTKGYDKQYAATNDLIASSKELRKELGDLDPSLKGANKSLKAVTKSTDEATTSTRFWRTELDRMSTTWKKSREDADHFSDSMGRAFGRGARNDFINIIGVITRGLTDLSGRFVSLLESLPGLNRLFGGGGVLPGFVTTIPALVAGLAAVTLGLGLMTAAASGLLGILTALISVGFFGLVGAAAAVAGALVPLTFGIGTLALAIANLSDAQKNQLEPVGDAFGDLGDAAAESFGPHLVKNVDGFVRVLEGLEPVVRDVGDAMGRVLDDFMADLESPAWERFGRQVGEFLPGAVESLGTSFNNALGGMAGVFRAMIPLTERFLGWLEDITGEFNEWANSAAGQRQLREFFDKAGDSAAALGEFLGAATEALFKLLDSGNERGIDILDRMTAKIQEFSDWITSAEGQKALEDWFQQAEDLAVSLGHLAEDLIEFFDELDSEDNRKALNDFVELTGDLVEGFETLAGVLQIVLGPLLLLIGVFVKVNEQFEKLTGLNLFEVFNLPIVAVRELAEAIGKIDFGKILDSLSGFGRSILDGLTRPFRQAFEQLRNIKLPKFDLKNIFKFPPISYIANQFKDAASAVGKAIGKFDIKDIFKIPAISYIANQFRNGAAAVGKAIGKFDIKDIFKIPGISWIADKFRNGAEAVGRAIGKFDLANIFKIPDLDTIASHFSGLGSKIANQIGDVFVDIVPRFASGGLVAIGQELGSWEAAAERRLNRKAAGDILRGPQVILAGEEGPEAIVPLNRPLAQVDPAVRWLSAIAQGITSPTPMASGGIADRPIDITVITPTEDPRAVATETVNRLVAVGY